MSGNRERTSPPASLLHRLVPHPLLTLTVAAVWLMLLNDFSRGGLLFGLLLGLVVPKLTSAFWPQRPRVRRPLKIAEYAVVVLCDIVVANVKVAAIVVFRSEEHTSELQSLMRISYAVFCLQKK